MNRLESLRRYARATAFTCLVGVPGVAAAQPATPAAPPLAPPAPATPAAGESASEPPAAPIPNPAPPSPPQGPRAEPAVAARAETAAPSPPPSEENKPAEPFAFGDFTWLNGSNRQHRSLLDSEIFTGSFLLDVNYTLSKNRPIDNTVVGSTALSRDDEVTLAFMGFGGDFHYKGARARLMTQFGVRSVLVPRNDFSAFRGQFDLADALRYISEANGGVHINALNGINVDGGIFMSYVGLFSYDNFENWMYLPSFTSDNTPWFFNGIRVQVFTSDKLKIEPWLINGWQTYGKFNEMPGFGAQVLWRPVEYFSVLSNAYVGWDTQDLPGVFRFHSDNSATIRFYNDARGGFITRDAMSVTADIGGQIGNGVTAFGGSGTEGHCTVQSPCTSQFLSWMAYHRTWFGENFAFTFGGGMMHNPSRYLVLAPTGNASGVPQNLSLQGLSYVPPTSPYDYSPGAQFDAWDYEFGGQYMPNEEVTLDLEFNHRQASVPYFSGHGGVTSPDGYITTATPQGWRPDLVKGDDRIIAALLVRF
ncbi:MAG TPA: outer membrane beta-barrel protein [Polyangiaceae bacterium]|nr:outer membrane beta-barrel protein [Polyangiaceae bacterium]